MANQLPPPLDLGAHLPRLEKVPSSLFALDDLRERWRFLAGCLFALTVWPWLCWRVADAGWLDPVGAVAFAVAGIGGGLTGCWWGLVALREEMARERLRRRRAALESRMLERGYSALLAGYRRSVAGVYQSDPVLLNFDQVKGDLASLALALREVRSGSELLEGVREPQVVSVSPGLAASVPVLPQPDPVFSDYPGSLADRFVQRLLSGAPIGPKACTSGPGALCSEADYLALVGRLVAAGILIKDLDQGRTVPAVCLATWRDSWSASASDLAAQFAIEDAAHSWAMDLLAVAPSPAAVGR